MSHVAATQINKALEANGLELIEALVKATGGLTSLVALTDIMIEQELVSTKTQVRWFASSYGKSYDSFCEEHNYPHIKLPVNTNFINSKLVEKKGSHNIPKNTIAGFLSVVQAAENQDQLRDVLMGKSVIDGVNCPVEFKSLASLRSGMIKYFGMSLGSWEKLSIVDSNDVPEFLSLKTSPVFFKSYLAHPKSWKKVFYTALGYPEEVLDVISNDSSEQRKEGVRQIVKILTKLHVDK